MDAIHCWGADDYLICIYIGRPSLGKQSIELKKGRKIALELRHLILDYNCKGLCPAWTRHVRLHMDETRGGGGGGQGVQSINIVRLQIQGRITVIISR